MLLAYEDLRKFFQMLFQKSKGNLKKYPNFTPLKEHILKRMSRKSDTISFIHSHEILFNK